MRHENTMQILERTPSLSNKHEIELFNAVFLKPNFQKLFIAIVFNFYFIINPSSWKKNCRAVRTHMLAVKADYRQFWPLASWLPSLTFLLDVKGWLVYSYHTPWSKKIDLSSGGYSHFCFNRLGSN